MGNFHSRDLSFLSFLGLFVPGNFCSPTLPRPLFTRTVVLSAISLTPPMRICRLIIIVCLLTTLHKNFGMDLYEIFREALQWANEQMITSWWQSGSPRAKFGFQVPSHPSLLILSPSFLFPTLTFLMKSSNF